LFGGEFERRSHECFASRALVVAGPDGGDDLIDEVKSFLTANIFGGLESFISYKTQAQIDQVFLGLDTNRDGKISKYELQTAARLQGEVIYDSQINPFYEVVDTNRDGGISKYELTTFLQSPSQWTTLVFKYVDSNRDGYLNLYEQPNTDTRQGGYGHIEDFKQGVKVSGLYDLEVEATAMHPTFTGSATRGTSHIKGAWDPKPEIQGANQTAIRPGA
jgi:hypothetical protein